VLAANTQAPVVTETAVRPDFLQPLQVITQFAVHGVGQNLTVLAIYDITLPIQEPRRDLVLCGVLNDGDDALKLFGGNFTGTVNPECDQYSIPSSSNPCRCIPLVEVYIGLLANQVGVPATNTLDLGQGVHDLLLAIDVGVEETQDELEVRLLSRYER